MNNKVSKAFLLTVVRICTEDASVQASWMISNKDYFDNS